MIQHLLREAGGEGIDNELVSVAPDGFEAQADWTNLRSPETYLGYGQGQNLASAGAVAYDKPGSYVAPKSLQLNTWALGGNWTIEDRASVLNEAGGDSPSASMRATSISSCARGRARSSRSACWSTAKHPTCIPRAGRRRGGPGTLAQPRLYQPVGSLGRSGTAQSRSHSSLRASRRTSSLSASDVRAGSTGFDRLSPRELSPA